MALFRSPLKKTADKVKNGREKEKTTQTSQGGSNITSGIFSANEDKAKGEVEGSYGRTAQILAGKAAQEEVSEISSSYAETVIIADLERAFNDVKARAKHLNDTAAVTVALGNINREIQEYNDLMQRVTQLSEQDRFDPRLIASPNTKDYSIIYLSGLLEESAKHLDVLKSRYRTEPTLVRENIIKRITEEFKAINDKLIGEDIGRGTSKPTLKDKNLRSGFSSLAESAERRVDSDMGKTQEKPKKPMTLDDLLNGPML